MNVDLTEVSHTGSGNAQDKSPRGEVVSQDLPTSMATDATRVDTTIEVETGVKATRSISGQLTCHFCGRDNFKRACGLAQHHKSCQHRPNQETTHMLSCQHCQRLFKRPCGLAIHQKYCTERQIETADTNQILVCPKCNRSDFRRPCGLARHIKSCKQRPSELSSTLANTTRPPETSYSVPQSSQACQTEESAPIPATSQRNPHSARDSTANPFGPTLPTSEVTNFAIEEPLQLPSAGCRHYWDQSNAALGAIIRTEFYNLRTMPPQEALHQLEKLVYSFFYSKRQKTEDPNPHPPSRKKINSTTIKNVRKQLRSLRKEWRQQRLDPTKDTTTLRREFHQTHKRLKRLRAQQRSLEFAQKQIKELRAFRANPYKYGRRIFNNKSAGSPTFSAETADEYFTKIFADEGRETCYQSLPDQPPTPEARAFLSLTPPPFSDFKNILQSRRNSAAPGPNGIPNIVWKRCQCLQDCLYSIVKRVWISQKIPSSWQCAVVRLFHKRECTDDPANFRPISLSNCDGKIFFALIGKAIQEHMIKNSFFDYRIQKGFLPGVSGCLEHSALLTEAIRDARSQQRSICISWLDLRNAFGSVRHSLFLFAIQHYQLPKFILSLVRSYYDHLRVVIDIPRQYQTKPFHFAIGAFQGCTLSPTLFNLVIQLALDYLEQPNLQSLAYRFSNPENISLLTSAYADDLQLVTSMPEQNQCLLDRFDDFLQWSETMAARPNKCWCAALKKSVSCGYSPFDPKLAISGQPVNYLDGADFRYLGRPTNVQNSESRCRSDIISTLTQWLDLVDNVALHTPGKLWLYQHFIVAKMAWFFTALDLSLTFVRQLQAQANVFLKRWAGLPRPANTTILFTGRSDRAGLNITNLETFWKQMQAVRMDILKHSKDARCRTLYAHLLEQQSTWTRKYAPAVEHACASTVVEANPLNTDSDPLGRRPCTKSPPTRRKRLLNIIADIDNEAQLTKLRQLSIQSRWLEWTDVMCCDLTWRRLLHGLDGGELRFTLQVITNTAPTPDNLRRWGQQNIDPACELCGRPSTLRHVLNGCYISLRQGRFTWRHDNVLRVLQKHLIEYWTFVQHQPQLNTEPFIRFRSEGAHTTLPSTTQRTRRPLFFGDALRCASDWQFLFDVDGGYSIFPPSIAVTTQRPDAVLFSSNLRVVILLELTVPLEDRVAAAHTIKANRYANLLATCESNGWHTAYFPFEVGSRGFVAHSLSTCLHQLGFPNWRAKKVRRECSRVALRSSYVLYLRRSIQQWSTSDTMSL